eukprot:182767_1
MVNILTAATTSVSPQNTVANEYKDKDTSTYACIGVVGSWEMLPIKSQTLVDGFLRQLTVCGPYDDDVAGIPEDIHKLVGDYFFYGQRDESMYVVKARGCADIDETRTQLEHLSVGCDDPHAHGNDGNDESESSDCEMDCEDDRIKSAEYSLHRR